MADLPWTLRGEGMMALVYRARAPGPALPPRLRAAPGPAAVVAMQYDDSPFGPYVELSVLVPARLGLRLGMFTVAMVVTSAEARIACRLQWGLPTELGDLGWSAGPGGERTLSWDERNMCFSGHGVGPSLFAPFVPVRSVAWRPSGPVVLTRRLRARARVARCRIDVDAADELAWLAGQHPGVALSGARVVAAAARRPAGLLSSVPWRERADGGAPEPAG